MKQLSIEELNASGNLTGIKLGGTSADNELLIRSIINGLIDAGVVVAKEYTDSQVMQDAPKDGKVYGRKDGEWVVIVEQFLMIVTSPTQPTLIDIEGGTIITTDNGDGTFTFESADNITHFKFDNNKADITKVEILNESLTDLTLTFSGLSFMTEFIANQTSFSNVTDCYAAWYLCSALTSFPLIDLSSVTHCSHAWYLCSALTSFPLIDLSSVVTCQFSWNGCSALTNFPLIDLSSVTNITESWRDCSALTNFPLIDLSSVTNITESWRDCSALHSFTGLDFSSLGNGTNAFLGCTALTQPPASGTDVRDGNNATQGTWNIT